MSFEQETVLTILAPGANLFDDVNKYGIVGDVMAVSQVIADYSGEIKYAVCWYDKYLDLLMQLRELKCRNTTNVVTYTRPLHCVLPINNSGLLALSLAQDFEQYKTVRVLGMPVDDSGHYYDILRDYNDLRRRFTFQVEEWETTLPTWTKFKTSPGNLTKYFQPL